MGDDFGWALAQNVLALAYRYLGDPQNALICYQESLRINREAGNYERTISTTLNIARVYMTLGDKETALSNVDAAYSLLKTMDLPKLKKAADKLIQDINLIS